MSNVYINICKRIILWFNFVVIKFLIHDYKVLFSSFYIHQNSGAKVVGITLSESQLKYANNLAKEKKVDDKVSFAIMDYCNTSFESNSFDVVWACESVSSAVDKVEFIKEAYRVLKKGGTGIFQVPIDMKREKTFQDDSITNKLERNKIFGQYDHVRVYGKDYFKKLENIGFKVKQIDYSKKFTETEILKYSIIKGEIIPVCTK